MKPQSWYNYYEKIGVENDSGEEVGSRGDEVANCKYVNAHRKHLIICVLCMIKHALKSPLMDILYPQKIQIEKSIRR